MVVVHGEATEDGEETAESKGLRADCYDEKEYLHLGCLLEEIFTEARIQMITTVISAKGVVRTGQFSRVEEYIYILAKLP